MKTQTDHISVCICTYKRPKLLEKLLNSLQGQQTDGLFTYSAVVVDNDHNRSAKATVDAIKQTSRIDIAYHVEPEQNIALARNKAVDKAQGDYIAFIDDDEFPEATWLLHLYKTLLAYKADGVLGPVRPYYPANTPEWLIKSGLCERPEHDTGTLLNWLQTRTGNVLLKRGLFENSSHRFDPKFGRTGGEDIDFFKRMMVVGKLFVWCNTAPVYETVPPERWEKSYYTNKYLRIGGLTGEKYRKELSGGMQYLVKISMAFAFYLLCLPMAFLFGEQFYIKYLTKIYYYFGCISGFSGYVPVRFRQ